MRFIRNEIQTPKPLLSPEKRKTLPFFILAAGVCVLIVGVAGFFSAFFFRDLIQASWGFYYRDVQNYSITVAGAGVILYIIAALILRLPLRKTTYYKISTIMKNEPFDPPRKNDFTKAVYARLYDLGDEWAYFSEVRPPDCDFVIPQVIVGPGGVFTSLPIAENPERKALRTPDRNLKKPARNWAMRSGSRSCRSQSFPIPNWLSPTRRTANHGRA